MAFFTSNPQLHSIIPCKSPWTPSNSFKFHFPSSYLPTFSPLLTVRTPCAHIDTTLTTKHQEIPNETSNHSNNVTTSSGFSQSSANGKRVGRKNSKRSAFSSVEVENPEKTVKGLDSSEEKGVYYVLSNLFLDSIRKYLEKNVTGSVGSGESNGKRDGKIGKGFGKRRKVNSQPGGKLKVALDRCSKNGDFLGALIAYDLAQGKGVKMDQWIYTVILYICSCAASDGVERAKSGGGGRSLSYLDPVSEAASLNPEVTRKLLESFRQWKHSGPSELDYVLTEEGKNNLYSISYSEDLATVDNGKPNPQVKDGTVDIGIGGSETIGIEECDYPQKLDIEVPRSKRGVSSTKIKEYALVRGFEIFHRMCREEVPINEASLTSAARLCMALGDGDMAFFMVKQMKPRGIDPRLRSYGPALSAFCTCGDVDKAFTVEQYMLEHGVCPEELELEALLKVSIEAGRSDKVYYLLDRLRRRVRQVSSSIAVLLEKWFTSKVASKVGKRKVDERSIREAIENGGGGWHGQGWLGKGKWNVLCTHVGTDGLCKCCGQKLATVDLDPVETENFAKLVASLAAEREKNSSFQQFQKWLDYCGPFEAVVDGTNVGALARRKLRLSEQGLVEMLTRVNAVVNGIRPLLPSKKWPLIVLYHRRLTSYDLDKPVCKKLIDKWKTADALYATPTGSNVDWYWLYAAIKCKCLIVTNDEMREHLFHLLGDNFFPKWKERHQVRFSFSDTGPVIHMPPPYSIVIQESEKGHWHIPIASEHDNEGERTWLCITRGKSPWSTQVTATMHEDNHSPSATQVTATIHEDNHLPEATQVSATIQERNHSPEATQTTVTIHESNHSPEATQATATTREESQSPVYNKGSERSNTPTKTEATSILANDGSQNKDGKSKQQTDKLYERIMNIMSTPKPSISKDPTILPQIEAAEKLGGCVIDFEI